MGVDIHIIEQYKKTSKYSWETIKTNQTYVGRDYNLFSFLSGIRGTITPFKEPDNWKNVENINLTDHDTTSCYGLTTYSIQELKIASKKYKELTGKTAKFCKNCKKEYTKKQKTHTFFKTYILKGNFYLINGYCDYRLLLCFN